MSDLIDRQKDIDVNVLKEWIENWFTMNRYYHPYAKNNNIPITELYDILEQMPSAEPETPPYVAEIEAEYKKWINVPYIRKPLAKALYEVWKKHDREDAERRDDE